MTDNQEDDMKLTSIESQIITATIYALVSAGFQLSVFDGEETVVSRSTDMVVIQAAMRTTDEDYLYVYRIDDSPHYGWVRFVYGNDDIEVINDYTTNLEEVMAPVFDMIDEYTQGSK